ncbi:MAG: phage head-tail connector protein, partial [Myxococcota bacterium]
TAVQTRLALDLSQLKELLGIAGTAEDTKLQLWLDSAKEEADSYLQNPFWQQEVDAYSGLLIYSEPVVELPIPSTIKLGVVEFVKGMRSMAPVGVSEEEVGDLKRKYSRFATRDDLLREVRGTYWASHKLMTIG